MEILVVTTSRRSTPRSSTRPPAPTMQADWRGLLAPPFLALIVATGCSDSASADRKQNLADVPLEQRIGWLDENCFAIDNASLTKGTPVAIVALDEQPTVIRAQIQLTPRQATRCAATHAPALRASGAQRSLSFYELRLPQNTRVTLGVGVVGEAASVASGLDVNGDRTPENFTACTTNDGVAFGVWPQEPYRGNALWRGHYSLGVATEPNCPAAGN